MLERTLPNPIAPDLARRTARVRGQPQSSAGPVETIVATARSDGTRHDHQISIEIVRTHDGFRALEADWTELFAHSAKSFHVFQSYNWAWHFLETYRHAEPDTLAIAVAREYGKAVLIWPLMVSRAFKTTELEWLGEPISQYGDVILSPDTETDRETLLAQTWSTLVRELNPDAITLRRVRADANLRPFLQTIGADVTDRQIAPSLTLTKATTYAEHRDANASSKSRKKRRRAWRMLEAEGPLSLDQMAPSENAASLAAHAIHLKRSWLADRGLVSRALSDDNAIAFFRAVCGPTDRPVGANLHVLYSNGRPASIQIYFDHADRSCLHLIVYDLDFERHGCGLLHLDHTFKNRFDNGSATIDLLAPAAHYKSQVANNETAVLDYAVPLTLKGRLLTRVYQGQLRPRLKAGLEHMPIALRRRLLGRS